MVERVVDIVVWCSRGASGGGQGGSGPVPITTQEPAAALQAVLGDDGTLT